MGSLDRKLLSITLLSPALSGGFSLGHVLVYPSSISGPWGSKALRGQQRTKTNCSTNQRAGWTPRDPKCDVIGKVWHEIPLTKQVEGVSRAGPADDFRGMAKTMLLISSVDAMVSGGHPNDGGARARTRVVRETVFFIDV